MDSLFPDDAPPAGTAAPAPLAERMRPRTFDEFVGQEELLARGRPLRQAIERDLLQSIILWGPPGTGKTTLARIIAETTKAKFVSFSAVLSGIKEIRDVMARPSGCAAAAAAAPSSSSTKSTASTSAQQDAFLPRVEAGDIVLIGATTENPSFEVNAALLSRSKVFVLRGLSPDEVQAILERALRDPERGLGDEPVDVEPEALRAIALYANGDARSALDLLELSVGAAPAVDGRRQVDRRAGAADHPAQGAALRQVGRGALQPHLGAAQVDAQQRPRRDGLLAGAHGRGRRRSALHRPTPGALRIGGRRQRRPAGADRGHRREGGRPLHGHARGEHGAGAGGALPGDRARRATPSTTPTTGRRSGSSKDVASPVPLHLRNAPTTLMKTLDYGKGYRYAHDEAEAVADMSCLPPALEGRTFYQPTERGFEKEIKRRLDGWAEIKRRRRTSE